MALKFGSSDVSALKLGSQAVSAVYLGADQVDTGGGGGGNYIAKAVRFDGATSLIAADFLGITNSHIGVLAFWAKVPSSLTSGFNGGIVQGSNDVNYVGSINGVAGGVGVPFSQDLDSADFSNTFGPVTAADAIPQGVWVPFILSWDTNFANGSRLFALYNNDVSPTPYTVSPDTGAAFLAAYESDGHLCVGGNAGDGLRQCFFGDLAEVYFNPNISLVQPDDTILLSDIRRFLTASGKPADPGTDSNNFFGLGSAPLFLSGDKDTFANNLAGAGSLSVANMSHTKPCELTADSALVTPDNLDNIFLDLPLRGDGIPDGTTIVSLDADAVTFTISNAATLTQSSDLSFGGLLTNASTSPSD